jgi:anti-sigma B factor antagonist
LEWHVIIRQPNRASVGAVEDGGSEVAVMTIERVQGLDPLQLELSCATDGDGNQIISVTGELDIATAEQAYAYISDVIDAWPTPVSVDLSGLTFCDASGLGALARVARHARQAGRQLKLTAARPSLRKIMRITGLDRAYPELAAY